jgi:hypothetical protein
MAQPADDTKGKVNLISRDHVRWDSGAPERYPCARVFIIMDLYRMADEVSVERLIEPRYYFWRIDRNPPKKLPRLWY